MKVIDMKKLILFSLFFLGVPIYGSNDYETSDECESFDSSESPENIEKKAKENWKMLMEEFPGYFEENHALKEGSTKFDDCLERIIQKEKESEEIREKFIEGRKRIFAINQAEEELVQKYPEIQNLMSIEGIIQEAREKYGIDPQKALPLKDIDSSSVEAQLFAAHVTNDAIIVNRNALLFQPIGARRITLFHEISHERNADDKKMAGYSNVAGLIAATANSAAFLKKTGFSRKGFLTIPLSVATFLVSKLCALNIHHHSIEHRADIDGITHAACSQCAKEFAADKRITYARSALKEETNPSLISKVTGTLLRNRYLSPATTDSFVQALEGKTCKAHQLIAEFPIIQNAIEAGQTNMLNACNRQTQEIKEKNKLLKLEQITKLHDKQSQGPLLNEFI